MPKYEYDYPMFSMTVDVMLVDSKNILMIRRGGEPYKGKLALPGGFVEIGETLTEAAERELKEELGITLPDVSPQFVMILDAPNRDSRNRVVSVVFMVEYDTLPTYTAGDDAASAILVPLDNNYGKYMPEDFAFDHLVPILYRFPGFFTNI